MTDRAPTLAKSTSFGSWLRERRKELDLTQFDLADRVGCSEDTVQKIERGERRPSKQIAQRLAECLRVPPDEHEAFVVAARAGDAPGPYSAQARYDPSLHASTDWSETTNLPTPLTPLIGREEAVADACSYLLDGVRLLTLTGAPGIGKTRLSLQVALALLPEFLEGVYLVELAPIGNPQLVASTIAGALGVSEVANQPLIDILIQHLKAKAVNGRRTLLLLDNFEQVLDAAPVVVELLTGCPQLSVLVTSREALHVGGEQQLPVPPLRVPDLSHLPDWQLLPDYPAVELFVQRAGAADPGFQLTEENFREVAAICARLEGLPLAIELAAARIQVLPPRALLPRLESRLSLLAGRGHALPQRQQTLRNAIGWSYELLSDEEKKLFRRLAVFVGGRSIEAVEVVCNFDGNLGIDVVEGLISLVDKNLLRREEGFGGEPRFVMLEMIHEYGREKLQESGEHGAMRRAHAQFFTDLAEAAKLKVWGGGELGSLDRLEEEHDNLRAAIEWSHSVEGDIEIELRLVVALGRFWEARGYLTEGRERIEAVLSRPESRREKVKSLRAWTLGQAEGLAYWQADFASARSAAEEALSLFREIGERQGIMRALTDLWDVATAEGGHEQALLLATESLRISHELGDIQGTAVSLVLLGWSEMYLGLYTEAAANLEEAVSVARKTRVLNRIALALAALGDVRLRQGNYEQAVECLEESLALHRQSGHRSYTAANLGTIALVAIRQKDYPRAISGLMESLKIRKEIGDKGGVAWCLEKFAQIESAIGDAARAVHFLGAARALREGMGTVVDSVDQADYDRMLTILQNRLGEEAFRQAWQEGKAMSTEQAIRYALEDGASHS
jgi:predicted ATPase/transcriptional regulator with XRE-family HTH domain